MDEPVVLAVGPTETVRETLRTLAGDARVTVLTADDAAEAIEVLSARSVSVVLARDTLPGPGGSPFLGFVQDRHPAVARVTLTDSASTRGPAQDAGTETNVLRLSPDATPQDLLAALRAAIGEVASDGEERLLREEAGIAPEQIARARRIASRMQKPRTLGEILVDLGQLPRGDYERLLRIRRKRLGIVSLLRETGSLRDDGFEAWRAAKQKAPGKDDRSILVEGGLVTEEQYLSAVSEIHDIPLLEPRVGLVDAALLAKTSIPFLARHRAFPLRVAEGKLTVILANPLDRRLVGELETIFGVPVTPCCAPSARIAEALATLERLKDGKGSAPSSAVQYREIQEAPESEETGEGAIQIVDYLLTRAIELGASDLHIEPMEDRVRVRVRVDGGLRGLTELPADFAGRILSRVKVLAGADIAERRLHQDGRIFVKVEGREVDVRVSIYASNFGETLVLRILDRRRGILPLDKLEFHPKVLDLMREVVLRTASGLVLVTGPTGSGKTSTLYSFVDFVNAPDLKVITCEDPVEFVIHGITQCSVNEKTGPTFADSLKSIVRQDPDVIVVGEIRDSVTANLAIEAALTGHKVYSSLHTEDAVGAVARLTDMGAEPYLIASTLCAIVAQRLVRRVCPACSRSCEPERRDLRYLGLERHDVAGGQLVAGAGCARCGGTGFRGRLAIHEVLVPDDDFRDAVLQRLSTKDLRRRARDLQGFLTLQEDGVLKAVDGKTTLTEVITAAPRDAAARSPRGLREGTWCKTPF